MKPKFIFDLSEVLTMDLVGVEKHLSPILIVPENKILPYFGGQLLDNICRGEILEDVYLQRILTNQGWHISIEALKRRIRENFHNEIEGTQSILLHLANKKENLNMTEKPVVWHYGLMAEYWAEFNSEARETSFFLQEIAKYGQPVLDVGCGTGRILLPLLHEGINIDGCDISADMLHYCKSKVNSEGFSPNLYNQPMHAFDLPRKYKTIYICNSFDLTGSRKNALETLRRCYAHLEDGGALLLNIQPGYTSPETWELWVSEKRLELPQPWPENGHHNIAADGNEYVIRFRLLHVDPLEQNFTRQVRLEKWQSAKLIAAEEYTLRESMFLKNELLLMLSVAGFHGITVRGDYTDEPATADHEELVFTAIR